MLKDAQPNRARGPDRAQRDVPPRADGEHPELLRAQARARGGALSASAARDGARRDLRDHGLPGAGDAGRRRSSAATRSAAPTCCAARWARRSPRRWRRTARSSARARRRRASRAAIADEVFDLMEKFAGYGFNKSHAAAYSLLAYQTAWIKAHFAAEFFAANMIDRDRQQRQAEGARRRCEELRRDDRDRPT